MIDRDTLSFTGTDPKPLELRLAIALDAAFPVCTGGSEFAVPSNALENEVGQQLTGDDGSPLTVG